MLFVVDTVLRTFTVTKPGVCWSLPALLLVVAIVSGCGGGSGSPNHGDTEDPNLPTDEPVVNETNITFLQEVDVGLSRQVVGSYEELTEPRLFSGGIAAGDYDQDGDTDLYVVGRNTNPNHLYENQGDGTFEEVGAALGVDVRHWGSGPAFGDIDGDGDLDLFVGAVQQDPIYLFENRINEEEEAFVDITLSSLIRMKAENTVSALFFDYDRDGYMDLFTTHWGEQWAPGLDTEYIWRNNGDNTFSSASHSAHVAFAAKLTDWSYTPNLTDIDGDGDADFLIASDYVTSEIYSNRGDGTFDRITDRQVLVDQNGMGAAIADFDRDGDMDWFVTSIYDLDVAQGSRFGNRLYRNLGGGIFEDATDESVTANGDWGWGACAADFDQDGHIDLVMVNGWVERNKDFRDRPVRFWRNLGEELQFREMGEVVGITNDGQGRGVICFDSDGDGDQDVIIVNNSEDHIVYYRNQTDNGNNFLIVELEGLNQNRYGVGARVTVSTDAGDQIRDLGGSNNYVSHNPLEVHFGVGTATTVNINVLWPDQTTTILEDVAVNQILTIQATELVLGLTVVHGDGSGTYEEGDEIQITAREPEENYHFSHWSSSGGGAFADIYASNTTFTMPADSVSVTANYLPGVGPDEDVSSARRWNEVLLQSIRNDWARPTVHARNLFHTSAAMYDAWAAYATVEDTWLLGKKQNDVSCEWEQDSLETDEEEEIEEMRNEALSHAMYRIIRHRFQLSPRASQIRTDADALMAYLGYDVANDSTDWEDGSPASLGNHIGGCYIDFGMSDGANEANDYANVSYLPVNPPLEPNLPGNPNIVDHNRWQPLALESFVDQAGNPSTTNQPDFLSPEWGIVWPFSLQSEDLTIYVRDDFDYQVFHDPGSPPLAGDTSVTSEAYRWGFSLVAIWSSHLDTSDDVMWDISPASLGNTQDFPDSSNYEAYSTFYDLEQGGDLSVGYDSNPITGEPYEPQIVPRGDYTRVLAEFWADGPDSETPPGHWFTILNEVNVHPMLVKRLRGSGPILGDLEWDVKAYFALGGTMHDVAIAAWGIKGWYDYIRPVSAIRAMADLGQSSDSTGPNYDPNGIPLKEGFVELVGENDDLVGENGEHLNKIKLFAWRGPDYIDDPEVEAAGVGWILAENWWPYQRPTFVTPPFAGFVSGHSTYSRAAAEVLTGLTGSEYFPGGMSQFEIKANEFLVFEEGPSVDMTLQWAKYYDASDQCSLSRIWGGIHPPADDIPGRIIGISIGKDAFEHAMGYFYGEVD